MRLVAEEGEGGKGEMEEKEEQFRNGCHLQMPGRDL